MSKIIHAGPKTHRHHAESKVLAWVLGSYIVLCFIIAGINFAYAPSASPEAKATISFIWHFYENEFKTGMIILASVLSWRLVSRTRKSAMYKRNLLGLCIAALLLHIVAPAIAGNHELYMFLMPIPWSSVPLQVLDPSSPFFAPRVEIWGVQGALLAFGFWVGMGIFLLVGTLIQGRRLQCSTLCMFNGFSAEIFSTVFPLLGQRREIGKALRRFFAITRWAILAIALFYSAYWILRLCGVQILAPEIAAIVTRIETYKYLVLELLMAMLFWLLLNGRGYCQYCPLGTVLAGLGKLAGQRIETTQTACVQCGKCLRTCPMGIDVMGAAAEGRPMRSPLCVGCGHCVDQCPAGTLRYTTNAREFMRKKAI